MKIKDQLCSLELAKQLKELGVKQSSYWCWKKMKSNKAHDDYFLSSWDIEDRDIHAYTVAELGEMLPEWVTSEKNSEGRFFVRSEDAVYNTLENTEADARAKMLIHLIKEWHESVYAGDLRLGLKEMGVKNDNKSSMGDA